MRDSHRELDSVTGVTQTYAVPAGWMPRSSSRKPLALLNAVAFAKETTRPLDQWTYFAKLRPLSWKEIALPAGLALVMLWALVSVVIQFGHDLGLVIFIGGAAGAGVLFFGAYGIRAALAARKRNGWPHRQGVGIGISGITLRLPEGEDDVPWDAVTAIRATFAAPADPKLANYPVLRIVYGDESVDVPTGILAAAPTVVFCALQFYWQNPAHRDELGDVSAQKRMAGWLPAVRSGT
jgi:hypothetical protein